MTDEKQDKPGCFGVLDAVFPKEENDLRSTPVSCLECIHKIACLQAAMNGPSGLKVQEELVDRAYTSGLIGFLERWSQKKDLQRRRKKLTN